MSKLPSLFFSRTVMASATLVCAFSVSGCGQRATSSPKSQGTLVPEENQREAQEEYGQQQMMMEDLNQTPSERAGARHDAGMEPARKAKRKD